MPNRSEYQPLVQNVDDDNGSDVGDVLPAPVTAQGLRRPQRPGHIDLSKLDTAFKRWTESIAQKVKRKKKVDDKSRKEIWHSVFAPQIEAMYVNDALPKTLDHNPPMTKADFNIRIVEAVKEAILDGVHPKMITKGSSGSYFARAKVDGKVQTVAVFKPKDEEPYGNLNPKTTKWLHRQFRWIIPFGRACLIPNLSYISEAAASLLDERLKLYIVPRTELASLSSPAFYYDWLDRTAAKKGKPLPDKIGSMQYFLHGFTDASEFLRKHPWPGRAISDTFDDSSHRKRSWSAKAWNTMKIMCGKTGVEEDFFDDEERDDERALFDATERDPNLPFYWSPALQDSFREELEKYVIIDYWEQYGRHILTFDPRLVILDYLMLNTDRGADNYMIKVCKVQHGSTLVDVAPSRSGVREMPQMTELRRTTDPPAGSPQMVAGPSNPPLGARSSQGGSQPPYTDRPHIHIAAIDNSLSFPHEHPKGWRSYTYGWLYLPVTIIGRPFSQKTRDHFLPMLTSKEWWSDTTYELRKLFAIDPDFHPKMFNRQLAVIKGQAWNIVQSLKHSDEGPLELTRRQKVLVWDDELEISDDNIPIIHSGPVTNGPKSPQSPHTSIDTVPVPVEPPRSRRSQSVTNFPPPMRRVSTEFSGVSRPVSFSAKFSRVHPATTGVIVLEHMERLDAVEASLKRLGVEEEGADGDEETDVGTVRSKTAAKRLQSQDLDAEPILSPSGRSERLTAVPENDGADEFENGMTEEDLVAMSKSMPHLESPTPLHTRWTTTEERPSFDWIDAASSPRRRLVIAERLETVNTKPLLSFW